MISKTVLLALVLTVLPVIVLSKEAKKCRDMVTYCKSAYLHGMCQTKTVISTHFCCEFCSNHEKIENPKQLDYKTAHNYSLHPEVAGEVHPYDGEIHGMYEISQLFVYNSHKIESLGHFVAKMDQLFIYNLLPVQFSGTKRPSLKDPELPLQVDDAEFLDETTENGLDDFYQEMEENCKICNYTLNSNDKAFCLSILDEEDFHGQLFPCIYYQGSFDDLEADKRYIKTLEKVVGVLGFIVGSVFIGAVAFGVIKFRKWHEKKEIERFLSKPIDEKDF